MLALLLTIAFAATSEPAASQPASQPVQDEDVAPDVFDIFEEQQEIFTGARGAIKVRESGSALWVIDRATIEATAATSIADILRMVPGMYVREIAPGFVETHARFPVLIPDNQTLFLVDGRSLQFDNFGYTDKMGIEVYDIERVEVIMGPASTLYGTNAFAGVVNIVTKTAQTNGTTANVNVRGGIASGSKGDAGTAASDGVQAVARAFADTTYKTDTFGFRGSVGVDYLPSFVPIQGFSAQDAKALAPHGRVNASLAFSEQVNGWTLRQRAAAMVHNSMLALAEPALARFQDYSLTMHANRPNIAKEGDELSFIVWGRATGIDHTFYRGESTQMPVSARSGTAEIFAQYRTPKFLLNNQLSLGTQIRFAYVDQQGLPADARFQHIYSLFAEDVWRPIDRLVITAGVRIETQESPRLRAFSRFNVAPRASIVWLINDNHSLRMEAASAFRNPSLFESFIDAVDSDGVPWFHGGPATLSEQLLQISLGYNGRIDWFRLRAEFVAIRINNIIVPSSIGADDPAGDINGVPVAAYPDFGSKQPLVFVNFPDTLWIPVSSLRLEADIKKVAKIWGFYHFAPVKPEHQAGLGAQLSISRVTASTQLYFQDSMVDFTSDRNVPGTRENAGRIIWNAQVSVKLDEAGRFNLALAGTNLLDIRFHLYPVTSHVLRDYSDGERIGQRVWLELRVAL